MKCESKKYSGKRVGSNCPNEASVVVERFPTANTQKEEGKREEKRFRLCRECADIAVAAGHTKKLTVTIL